MTSEQKEQRLQDLKDAYQRVLDRKELESALEVSRMLEDSETLYTGDENE
jgi:hypothetical protein